MTLDSIKRYETWILTGLTAALLVVMTPLLGVWEPWESDVATAIDLMRGEGSWWAVQLPGAKDGLRGVAELPYGLWPSAGLASLIGTNEWALRLPGVMLGLGVVLLGFTTTRRLFGRGPAWLAAIGLLSMPMFIFHSRLALGTAVGMQSSALAALAFLHLLTAPHARASWRFLAWLSFAFAGLAAGVTGLAGPVGVLVLGGWVRARHAEEQVAAPGVRRIVEQGLLVVVLASVALFGFGLTFWGAIVAGVGAALLVGAALFGGAARTLAKMGLLRQAVGFDASLVALLLLAGGWVMAATHLPDGQSVRALLLWINDFDGPGTVAQRPAFDGFVHQIGFGLFPLGALVPLAFADAIWRADERTPVQQAALLGVSAWFALGFLAPALGMPFSHIGFFFAAPAVAFVVGIYLHRAVTGPPQPLLALVAVVLLALLDSNLKHQTQALADTLVGAKVDAFPPKLEGWRYARILSLGLLGVLILFQGGAIKLVRPLVTRLFYPTRQPRLFEAWLAFWGIVLGGAATVAVAVGRLSMSGKTYVFRDLVNQRFWGRIAVPARWAILFGVFFVVGYVIVLLLWRLRAKRLDGERSGVLLTLTGRIVDAVTPPNRAAGILAVVLLAWAGLMNLGVTSAMTTNFSQKEIISRYADLKDDGEPLLTYQLDARNSSFYARSLDSLDRKAFREQMPKDERVFAIIPRKNLASVNKDFRALTGRTMPVLDDRSYRFLLISNQLEAGEKDYNPITRALVSALPKGATKTNHVFDDRIELVGWQLDPPQPRPGAELTISLFWRAKKRISGRWKVFVHIDAPGQRIHGDHDPVEGMFPTDNWRPGDLVRDDHRVIVKRTTARNNYTFYVGLFRGRTRMPITVGDKTQDNRAKIGRVRVQ